MSVFLHEPRYSLGCFGFYTEPTFGKRIVQAGFVLTGLAVVAAIVGGIAPAWGSFGTQAIFLIVSAWVLVFGLMRLAVTGFMWVISKIFEEMAGGVPGMASAMYRLRRAYWIGAEIFVSTGFLGTLAAAVLVGFGALAIE